MSPEEYIKQKLKLLAKKLLAVDSLALSVPSRVTTHHKKFICEQSDQAMTLELLNTEPQAPFYLTGLMEKLKVEAVQHRMASKIDKLEWETTEIRERCQACRATEYKLAEKRFINRKVNLLRKPSIEKKVEQCLYEQSSTTLIGQVVSSCLRPCATGDEVWQAIREKLAHEK